MYTPSGTTPWPCCESVTDADLDGLRRAGAQEHEVAFGHREELLDTAPDAIALRSFALIFEETCRPGRHRVVTAAEGGRDPEHAGAFTVFVARPRILFEVLYREFR